MAIKQDITLKW